MKHSRSRENRASESEKERERERKGEGASDKGGENGRRSTKDSKS